MRHADDLVDHFPFSLTKIIVTYQDNATNINEIAGNLEMVIGVTAVRQCLHNILDKFYWCALHNYVVLETM